MRALTQAFTAVALACAPLLVHAQDAVLLLSPAPTVSTQAGIGQPGFAGDGAAATLARLASPTALAQDAAGNTFVADTRNHRIRRIDTNGVITTVAGTGKQGFAGDGGPAVQADLDSPQGLALAADGTLYLADTHNHRIRRVDTGGTITTVAGTGQAGFSGDGNLATAAQLSAPQGLALGATGALYLADTGNHRIRRIDTQGNIATVAGDGVQDKGSGGAGVAAHLDSPTSVAVRSDGTLLIADRRNDRILMLATDGSLQTLNAGVLRRPAAVASSGADTLVADTGHYRIARVSADGIGTVFGSGEQGVVNTALDPLRTPMGAPSAALPSSAAGVDVTALDREHGQLVQVALGRLTFPDTVLATSSIPRTVGLTNAGGSALTVNGIAFPAGFAAAAGSSCAAAPFTLAAGAACTITITFTPTTEGAAGGLLQVNLASGAPRRLLLAGSGVRTGTALASSTTLQTSGTVVYAGTPLTMTAAVLGSATTMPTGSVLFMDGTAQLGQGTLNGSAQATMTTSSLQAGTHLISARYSGDVAYGGSTSAVTQVALAAPPDFTFAASGGNRVTVAANTAGVVSLVLQPANGALNQTVTLSVDGFPVGTTVNLTPVPVTLAANPVTVTLSFKLPVAVSYTAKALAWTALLLPCTVFLSRPKRLACLACLFLPCFTLVQGCGGGYLSGNGSVSGQAAGNSYPITVTATCPGVSGSLTHTATFTVVVQ